MTSVPTGTHCTSREVSPKVRRMGDRVVGGRIAKLADRHALALQGVSLAQFYSVKAGAVLSTRVWVKQNRLR